MTCQHALTCSRAGEVIQMELLGLDTNHYGLLSSTPMPLAFIASVSHKLTLSKQISPVSQTNLFNTSQYQTYLSVVHLVQIFPWLVKEPVLMAIAEACFLSSSDSYDYSSLRPLFLKMSEACSQVEEEKTLKKSSNRLDKWGIWGLGNPETEDGGFPKTESEFSVWVITGNIQCNKVEPNRPTLQECLESVGSVMYRAASGNRIHHNICPTLRSLGNTGGKHQAGSGAWKVIEGDGTQRPLTATEFERLMGWHVGCTEKGIALDGKETTISKTQRQKMLGNGIVPAEIKDICNNLAPFFQNIQSTGDR